MPNDTMELAALKTEIEAIIGPVAAPELFKNRFREELFGHARDAYRVYVSRGYSQDRAIAAAIRDLGPAGRLRARFHHAIPPLTQWSYELETGRTRMGLRLTIAFALAFMLVCASLVFGVELVDGLRIGVRTVAWLPAVSVLGALIMLVAYIHVSFYWILPLLRRVQWSPSPSITKVFALATIHAASVAAVGLVLAGVLRVETLAIPPRAIDAHWTLAVAGPALMAFSASAMLLAAYYIVIRSAAETRRVYLDREGQIPDWPYVRG